MLVERNQLAELFHLQQFTFDHLLGQINQGVQNAEVAFLHGDFERLHVEPVAGQHALRVPPLRICGGTTAANLGFVNNVVVHQGGGVDDLDHRSETDSAATLIIEEF